MTQETVFLDAALEQQGIWCDTVPQGAMGYDFLSKPITEPQNIIEHWHGSFWSDRYKFMGISHVRGGMMASIPQDLPNKETRDLICVTIQCSNFFDGRRANIKFSYHPGPILDSPSCFIGRLYALNVEFKVLAYTGAGTWEERPCDKVNIFLDITRRDKDMISGTYIMGKDNGKFKLDRF